jgi:hypothetical protein
MKHIFNTTLINFVDYNDCNKSIIYNIPDDIIYNFDYRIYFYLYDDVKLLYDLNDNYGLLYHYYIYGLHNNRICNIDDVDKYINNNYRYNIKTSYDNRYPDLIISKTFLIKLNYYKELYILNQNDKFSSS